MLDEGGDAAIVGELADAAPAEMLGVAERYTGTSAAEEIACGGKAHGGSLDPLPGPVVLLTRRPDLCSPETATPILIHAQRMNQW